MTEDQSDREELSADTSSQGRIHRYMRGHVPRCKEGSHSTCLTYTQERKNKYRVTVQCIEYIAHKALDIEYRVPGTKYRALGIKILLVVTQC